MANIDYKLYQIDPIGLEQLSEFDLKTVGKFSINTNFTPFEDKVELHIYGEDDFILESIYDHRSFKFLQGSETVGITGASEVSLDPIQDSIDLNFELGGVKLVYNFLDNLYSEEQTGGEFFIQEISEDRTEVRLLSNQITEEEIVDYTDSIIDEIASDSYFNDFRLNVKNNDLLIGLNIKIQDYRDYKSVVVKLYEPLPIKYQLKQLLTIDRLVADSVGYSIETTITPDIVKPPSLKGPNFNIEEPDSVSYPTAFLNTDDLFSFPTNNTYREVNSLFKEKGIEVSIDYSDLSNFVHFSSAEERLRNFQYKLNLIESYQLSITSSSLASGFTNTAGNTKYWTDKIDSVVQNFDHYDRHLYYSSGSTSWPKAAPQTKPYINATGATTSSFMTSMLLSASTHDNTNNSSLINTIPDYLREDTNSVKYSIFTHMLGQHFDNIWIYTKALSDKYDNDNRRDYGISKDMVQTALKNFGVKLYNSFESTDDLFNTFTGKLYHSGSTQFEQSGSYIIASLADGGSGSFAVSGSEGLVNVDSLEDYKRDIHKRIYHNLPYILKTKGTERGLKALIAAFGVPTDNNIEHNLLADKQNITGLKVRVVGGAKRGSSPYLGPSTDISSSIQRIRTDNTGSLIDGDTLSKYSSILSRDDKYTDDIHTIEVGYSPTYGVNDQIKTDINSAFNIDNLIGDPREAYSSSYEQLVSQSVETVAPSFDTLLLRNKIGTGYQQVINNPQINVTTGSISPSIPVLGYKYSPLWGDNMKSATATAEAGTDVTVSLTNTTGINVGDELLNGFFYSPSATIWYGTVTEIVDGTTLKANLFLQIPDTYYVDVIPGYTPLKGRYLLGQNNNLVKIVHTTGGNILSVFTLEPISTIYGTGGLYDSPSTVKFAYTNFKESVSHNYGELVRYLKYYDNVLFKMIKDFVPARSNIDTGLIIKPHLLERNKIKQVKGSFESIIYTGSIDTAFISGGEAGAFTHKYGIEFSSSLTASYTEQIVAPVGVLDYEYHEKERPRYDGEFSGSGLDVYKHTLNDDNDWKYNSPGGVSYSGRRFCYYTVPISPTPTATPSISVTPTPVVLCPTLSTVGFAAQTGFSGSNYSSILPLGYTNPTGLKLHMSGAVNQLPDGDPIDELGFVIGTSTDPTVSGSGVLFQGVVAINGGGAAGTVGNYFNSTLASTENSLSGTTWIQPSTTYYMRAFASASSNCGDYVYGDTLSTTTGASTYIPSQSFDYGSAAQSTVCSNFHLDSGNNQAHFWTYDGTTFGVPFAIATHLYTAPIAEAAYGAPSFWYVSGSRQGSANIREVGSDGALNTNNNCPYTP